MSKTQSAAGSIALGNTSRRLLGLAVWVAAFVFATPLLILVGTSLQPPEQGYGLSIVPREITLDNYATVLSGTDIWRLAANSVVVTTATVVLVVLLGSLAAFGLVRHSFPGSTLVVAASMAGLLLPPAALIVPLFSVVRELNLLDTYAGLVGPYVALTVPVSLLLFYNAFRSVPRDIFDAADVDGIGTFQAYRRIAMPLSRPTVAAVVIITALSVWNEFLYALLLTKEVSSQTIQLAWVVYSGQYTVQFERQFALLIVISLPLIVLFLIFQRQFIAGLTAGATK